MKTEIEEKTDLIVSVNTFTVEPKKQEELIQMLISATEQVMKKQPGFISANIHGSLDGNNVVNYSQWASKDDYDHMQQDQEAMNHMQQAGKFAIKFEPILYKVVHVIHT